MIISNCIMKLKYMHAYISLCNNILVILTATEDYTEPSEFTVVFPSGTSSNVTTMINTTDDSAVEGDHNFTVSIINSSIPLVTVGTPSSMTVTIMDNDRTSAVWQ